MKKIGIICCLLLMSCGIAKNSVSEEKASELKMLVDSKNFTIVSHTAMPMASIGMQQLANTNLLGVGNTANSIDLTTNANHFKIFDTGVLSVSLPFYGESRTTRYSGNTGYIKFDGFPTISDNTYNASKKRYDATYEFKTNNDTYKVIIQIYLNSKARITVISGRKSSITYLGVVKAI